MVLTRETPANHVSSMAHLREKVPVKWPLATSHQVFQRNKPKADEMRLSRVQAQQSRQFR